MTIPELVELLGKHIEAEFYDGQVIKGKLEYCPGRDMNKRLHAYYKVGSRIFKVNEVYKAKEVPEWQQ